MKNKKIDKIEYDILSHFEQIYPELKGRLLSCIDKIKKVEREFTGVGAFISFKFENDFIRKLSHRNLCNERFNYLFLESSEFEHEVPVSIVFKEDGILDYIELEMGLKKRGYPNQYRIISKVANIIYDSSNK